MCLWWSGTKLTSGIPNRRKTSEYNIIHATWSALQCIPLSKQNASFCLIQCQGITKKQQQHQVRKLCDHGDNSVPLALRRTCNTSTWPYFPFCSGNAFIKAAISVWQSWSPASFFIPLCTHVVTMKASGWRMCRSRQPTRNFSDNTKRMELRITARRNITFVIIIKHSR